MPERNGAQGAFFLFAIYSSLTSPAGYVVVGQFCETQYTGRTLHVSGHHAALPGKKGKRMCECVCGARAKTDKRWPSGRAKWPVYSEKTRERFVVYSRGDSGTPLCAPLFLSNGGWVMLRVLFFFFFFSPSFVRSCRALATRRVTLFFLLLLVDVCPPPTLIPCHPPQQFASLSSSSVRPPPASNPSSPWRNFDYNPAQLLTFPR